MFDHAVTFLLTVRPAVRICLEEKQYELVASFYLDIRRPIDGPVSTVSV